MKNLTRSLIAAAVTSSLFLTNPSKAELNCDDLVNFLIKRKNDMETKKDTFKEVYRGEKGRYSYNLYKCAQNKFNKRTEGRYEFFVEMRDGKIVTSKKSGRTAYIIRRIK